MAELMASNGGCKLPCWWGIVVGESTDQAIRDMFVSQGIDHWVTSFDGSNHLMSLGYPYSDSPYYASDVSMQLWTESGRIVFLDVTGDRRPGEDSALFTQDWQQYRLAEILEKFGRPTHIGVHHEVSADPGPDYYQVAISYPEVGMELHYLISPEHLDGGRARICVDFEKVQSIRLMIFAPGSVAEAPVGTLTANAEAYDSWEEVTGFSDDHFFETFTDPENSACVEVR